MSKRVRLGVNIDHVATIRNARGGGAPDPVRAAIIAEQAGADGITLHIREDRRHVREDDLFRMVEAVTLPINLEIACAEEMLAIALKVKPHAVCLVPERREERTTEGGLDVAGQNNHVAHFVRQLREAGVRVSLFIDPDVRQMAAAQSLGAPVVEIHTGAFCEAVAEGDAERAARELEAIRVAATDGAARGLEIHAGHGITYESVAPIAAVPEVRELNIGHFIVGEAIFVGLPAAIAEMRRHIDQARGGA
ncbi:MAG: pyridoxine 5'-phosphate synthase [Hyphomonadaceae bacterium JAD_PAG50586_4]|nr:MAG: pyridoxine 5'-phosphate synthase [Hyphomonadaceae bacterium JAD_PAG50586_4]